MSIIPPLYLCPDCEGHGTIMYAGKVIFKRCSACESARRNARTGADRTRQIRPKVHSIQLPVRGPQVKLNPFQWHGKPFGIKG